MPRYLVVEQQVACGIADRRVSAKAPADAVQMVRRGWNVCMTCIMTSQKPVFAIELQQIDCHW